ncbi:hypothetical protein ACLX1H_002150 [Fusarium chlamydosporum]
MPRKKLSILCFGDSLTSGYFCHSMESHPYAIKLEDRLTGTFPEVDFDIVVNGYPGELASSERFYSRLKSACNYAFDLNSKIPYHSLSEQDRDRYWDDDVHMQGEGYDWMGNHIADALIDILWSEGTFEQPSDMIEVEEEFAFDEEDGNPRNINEGYIVVRKKDLD